MAFRLVSDAHADRPVMVCDVCGKDIYDLWNDKATGAPEKGKTASVVIHHARCAVKDAPKGAVAMPLIDFLRLFAIRNRVGNVGSSAKMEKLFVEQPKGKRFEA